eukprot:PhM_4_TR18895/c0_g1_i1/m.20347
MKLAVFREFIGTSTFASLPPNIIADVHNSETVCKKEAETELVQRNAKLFFDPKTETAEDVEKAVASLEKLGYVVAERAPKTSARPKEWPMNDRIIFTFSG